MYRFVMRNNAEIIIKGWGYKELIDKGRCDNDLFEILMWM